MKKILSLILAGLMTVSCAAFVAADDAAVEATDPTQAYAISFLAQNGIYHGKSNEEFVAAAADPIERYQMALFVARISTGWVDDYMWDYNYDWEDNTANNSTFTDLAGTAAESYLGAISYANQKGIIEGYSATKFGPTDGITYRDALTMVVRTMGYQGLIYPWGYIEKAVELGLTEGIEGVTYTDNLNRGQVAVILYNAMFAPCKGGETLAKSIFDVDFGWETIVITASDEASFNNKGALAAAGYVGFNIIEEDGTIGAKTYFVKEEQLGLKGDHKAELAVGTIYNALFTIDGDYASLVDYDSALIAVAVNNGITDDKGEAVTTLPIATALAPYTLVKEHAGKEYITYMGEELFVYELGSYEYLVKGDYSVAIDWASGNILEWNQATGAWDVAWYYNTTLEKYYEYYYDPTTKTIALNWMTDAEFAEWYATAGFYKTTDYAYVLRTSDLASVGKNPYAKLSLYNIDEDASAEIAAYKEYRIGEFTNSTMPCGSTANSLDHKDTNVKYPSYKIAALDDEFTTIEVLVEAGHEKHDTNAKAGFGWINSDAEGFKNEDGSYNNGYVMFDYNKTTGEIEVVKYIPYTGKGADEDSYVFTGILQAYSTANHLITIDGEKYDYSYDALKDSTMKVGNGSLDARTLVANELDAYLMQYVTALVVDGKVVDVDIRGGSRELIVVYDYAGITSDGYIAVYGYSTADAALGVYKINSYNGWKKGDYRYYPENANTDAAFEPGTVYVIKSSDAETKSYGVETYDIGEDYMDPAEDVVLYFEAGYRVVEDEDGNYVYAPEKAAATDTYIIITSEGEVYATTGAKLQSNWNWGWEVYGDILYKDGGKFVIFSDNMNRFGATANDIGFILYDRDVATVLEAAYDDAQGVEDYYLLGSTVSTFRAYNILTGTFDEVIASTNIDLVDDSVYVTIGNTVVKRVEWDLNENDEYFVDFVERCYNEGDINYAKYLVARNYTFDVDGLTALDILDRYAYDADNDNWYNIFGIDFATGREDLKAKIAADYIKTIKYFNVVGIENRYEDIVGIDIDALTREAGKEYYANIIIDVANKTALVYVYDWATVAFETKDFAADTTDDLLNDESYWTVDTILEIMGKDLTGTTDKIELDLTYAGKVATTYDDLCDEWSVKSVTLNKVGLNLVMDAKYHDEAEKFELGFGNADDDVEDYAWINDMEADLTEVTCANNCGLITGVSLTEDIEFVYDEVNDVWTAEVEFVTALVDVTVVFTYDYNNTTNTGVLTYTADAPVYYYGNDFVLGEH